ncbi:MAG: hypothetical protein HRT90_07275 [Candidatus Margulisbacteria bacterium]|nr:hypothetical protein [Candidatus Margulisiibacteriota bacterium]
MSNVPLLTDNPNEIIDSSDIFIPGLVHEINSPITYVMANIVFIKESFQDLVTVSRLAESRLKKLLSPTDCDTYFKSDDYDKEQKEIENISKEIDKVTQQSHKGLLRIAKAGKAVEGFVNYGSREGKEPISLIHIMKNLLILGDYKWKYITSVELNLCPNDIYISRFIKEFQYLIIHIIEDAVNAFQWDSQKEDSTFGQINIYTSDNASHVLISIEDNRQINIKQKPNISKFKGSARKISKEVTIRMNQSDGKTKIEIELPKKVFLNQGGKNE